MSDNEPADADLSGGGNRIPKLRNMPQARDPRTRVGLRSIRSVRWSLHQDSFVTDGKSKTKWTDHNMETLETIDVPSSVSAQVGQSLSSFCNSPMFRRFSNSEFWLAQSKPRSDWLRALWSILKTFYSDVLIRIGANAYVRDFKLAPDVVFEHFVIC